MAPVGRFSSSCCLLVLLLLPAVRSSFPRSGGSSSEDCGPGKAADCPDLSEKKSDLRVCDAGTCRFGGTCRENGADIKCVCQFHCHKKYVPVCGSNGDTYQNECFLRRAACKKQRAISIMSEGACYHDGASGSGDGDDEGSGRGKKASKCGNCKFGAECDEDSEDMLCMCNIVCNGHNDNPVCGVDGVTYDTPCHVREASCLKQLKIDIKHVGRCQDKSRKDDGMKNKPDIYTVSKPGEGEGFVDVPAPCPEDYEQFCEHGHCEMRHNLPTCSRRVNSRMTDRPGMAAGGGDDAGSIMALLERVAGLMDSVQATQQRMEERQLELENTVKTIQTDVIKLTSEHANTSSTVDRLLEKTRKVSRHIKDVRVRVENQNVRVKKVEATQGDLLAKNKFRVVIYQGDQEVKAVTPGNEPAEPGGSTGARADVEPDKFELPPESDDEYMVVEEADSSAAGRMKKTGLTRIESFKATFSKENISKTRENLGTKVNKFGERIVTAERREKIRQSGERLKQSGERLKETISKNVPAKLNLKKERTVAEGQEGAEGATEGAAPVPPPKGRKGSPDNAKAAADEGKADESEVPMYDMKQLS